MCSPQIQTTEADTDTGTNTTKRNTTVEETAMVYKQQYTIIHREKELKAHMLQSCTALAISTWVLLYFVVDERSLSLTAGFRCLLIVILVMASPK